MAEDGAQDRAATSGSGSPLPLFAVDVEIHA